MTSNHPRSIHPTTPTDTPTRRRHRHYVIHHQHRKAKGGRGEVLQGGERHYHIINTVELFTRVARRTIMSSLRCLFARPVLRATIMTRPFIARSFSGYPEHEIIRMPALSPTMTEGVIAQWRTEVGKEVQAGDIYAEIGS